MTLYCKSIVFFAKIRPLDKQVATFCIRLASISDVL